MKPLAVEELEGRPCASSLTPGMSLVLCFYVGAVEVDLMFEKFRQIRSDALIQGWIMVVWVLFSQITLGLTFTKGQVWLVQDYNEYLKNLNLFGESYSNIN